MQYVNFQTSRLVKELKNIFRELNVYCASGISYSYIINYIIKRIGEDTGLDLQYSLPEIKNAEPVLLKLHAAMEKARYDFKAAVELNLTGEIYEGFLDIETRKNLGLYYTPESIVKFIVDNTVMKVNVVENPFVKVLDPSCGSGYFLLKAYDVLKDKFLEGLRELRNRYRDHTYVILKDGTSYKVNGWDYWIPENIHCHIISHCIFGADIDEFGVLFTKNSLKLKDISGFNPEPNIVLCNSLVKWERTNHNLKEFWSNRFSFIIGNPPWVSLSRKYGKKIPHEILSYYKENYKGNTYLPNLYEYFIERSLELLKIGGLMGFLIPDRFAVNQYLASFRKQILEKYNIKSIKTDIRLDNIIADSMAIIIENNFNLENITEVYTCSGRCCIFQKDFFENRDFRLTAASYESRMLYKSINLNSVALKDIANTFTGFIGINKNIMNAREYDKQTPVLKGADIEKYKIRNYKFYDFYPGSIIGGTKDMHKLMCRDKIVIRKTGKSLSAALDRDGVAIEQSLYGIIITDYRFIPEYILALLNSKLMEWYYLNFLITNINSTPQLKKIHLDEIPVKCCSMEKQIYIKGLVDKAEGCSKMEFERITEKINMEIYDIYCIKKVPHGQHVERI